MGQKIPYPNKLIVGWISSDLNDTSQVLPSHSKILYLYFSDFSFQLYEDIRGVFVGKWPFIFKNIVFARQNKYIYKYRTPSH